MESCEFSDKIRLALPVLQINPQFLKFLLDGACALLFNLTFCSSVAYAVPYNPANTTAELAGFLDSYVASKYENFSKSLQQIPCNTTSSAQYSLARNCDHCDAAYKRWLCAVSIPRCEDFSNSASYLMPRAISYPFVNKTLATMYNNVTDSTFSPANQSRMYYNGSRNPHIDLTYQPGPYKEVLPCQDLCYDLVQSCPASLQFVCPEEGYGMNYTYGRKNCNAITELNDSTRLWGLGYRTFAFSMTLGAVLMSV